MTSFPLWAASTSRCWACLGGLWGPPVISCVGCRAPVQPETGRKQGLASSPAPPRLALEGQSHRHSEWEVNMMLVSNSLGFYGLS